MAVGRFFRQKVVGVEFVGVREHFLVTMNFERGDDDRGAHRQRYVFRRCAHTVEKTNGDCYTRLLVRGARVAEYDL